MFFRQVLHDDLGCASYLIADAGIAAVVDPKWEIEDYLALAEEHGFAIRYVLETHNHADHVSGRGRLAGLPGVTIHVSQTDGIEYPHETLTDGEAIEFGSVRIEALATPGHRPEHTAYLVYDRSRGADPWALLSGDSLFVGDVARPDLAIEPEDGARALFHSLRRMLALPGHVQLFPGHVGGSMCGGAGMSELPGSTLGYELRMNPLLSLADEGEFVRETTSGLGAQPPNFRRIVELNRGPLLGEPVPLERLEPPQVQELMGQGVNLIDGRAPGDFLGAHVPRSLNVTIVRATVGTRAAAVADPEAPVVVTAASEKDARRVATRLQAVGFRDVRGLLAGGIDGWSAAGLPLDRIESIDVESAAERIRRGEVTVLDVRDRDEWLAGHLPASLHVPVIGLRDEVSRVCAAVNGKPLAIMCAHGNRAAVAVSLLRQAGCARVIHVRDGGVQDLAHHGIALATED